MASSSSSSSGFLARPRRGSRSHQQHKEQQQHGGQPEPYTPVFQPAGYAYKIALPARPQPGQTPWPTHLPPVVHAPLSNATNRQRTSSSAVPSAQTQTQTQRGPMPQLTRSATLPTSYYPAGSSQSSTSARSSFASSSSARSSPPTSTSSSSSPSSWPHGLNPLLTSGALLWTLRLPPSYIKLRLSHLSTPGPLTYTHRSQPASAPSAHSLSILVALPGAVGPLRIACPPGTTLGALLDALYDLLHAPATRAEWAACNQPAAARAYRVRCGADGAQLAKGVRRVDLLGEGAAFAGLARGEASGEFVLRVVAL